MRSAFPTPYTPTVYYLQGTYETERGVHTHHIDFREYKTGLQVKDIEKIVNKLLRWLDDYAVHNYTNPRRTSHGLYKRQYQSV